MKKFPLKGEHNESMDSHFREDYCGKCELEVSYSLEKWRLNIVQVTTHKSNVLRF